MLQEAGRPDRFSHGHEDHVDDHEQRCGLVAQQESRCCHDQGADDHHLVGVRFPGDRRRYRTDDHDDERIQVGEELVVVGDDGIEAVLEVRGDGEPLVREEGLDGDEDEDEEHELEISERMLREPLSEALLGFILLLLRVDLHGVASGEGRFLDALSRHHEGDDGDAYHCEGSVAPEHARDAVRSQRPFRGLAHRRGQETGEERTHVHAGVEHGIAHRGSFLGHDLLDRGVGRGLEDPVGRSHERETTAGAHRPDQRISGEELFTAGEQDAAEDEDDERGEERAANAPLVHHAAQEALGERHDGREGGDDPPGIHRTQHQIVTEVGGELGQDAEVAHPFDDVGENDSPHHDGGLEEVGDGEDEFFPERSDHHFPGGLWFGGFLSRHWTPRMVDGGRGTQVVRERMKHRSPIICVVFITYHFKINSQYYYP